MRKHNQEIKEASTIQHILKRSKIIRIAMNDNDKAYLLPFNYGYKDDVIFIHCAREGKKLDLLKKDPKVCFEITYKDDLVKNDPACKWASSYQCVMGYGKISIIDDYDQKTRGLEIIMDHNGASRPYDFQKKQVDAVLILALNIQSITAKQSGNWDRLHNPSIFNHESERLLFRPLSMEDISSIHQLLCIPEVDKYNTMGIPSSLDESRNAILSVIDAYNSYPTKQITWKVLLKENSRFIGEAGLFLSQDKFKMGEIYYKLHPDVWNNGLGSELAKELIQYAFKKYDLHRIEAGVATENLASIRVLEKAGMEREGIRRKILPIRGQWKDSYHYSIINPDHNS